MSFITCGIDYDVVRSMWDQIWFNTEHVGLPYHENIKETKNCHGNPQNILWSCFLSLTTVGSLTKHTPHRIVARRLRDGWEMAESVCAWIAWKFAMGISFVWGYFDAKRRLLKTNKYWWTRNSFIQDWLVDNKYNQIVPTSVHVSPYCILKSSAFPKALIN